MPLDASTRLQRHQNFASKNAIINFLPRKRATLIYKLDIISLIKDLSTISLFPQLTEHRNIPVLKKYYNIEIFEYLPYNPTVLSYLYQVISLIGHHFAVFHSFQTLTLTDTATEQPYVNTNQHRLNNRIQLLNRKYYRRAYDLSYYPQINVRPDRNVQKPTNRIQTNLNP